MYSYPWHAFHNVGGWYARWGEGVVFVSNVRLLTARFRLNSFLRCCIPLFFSVSCPWCLSSHTWLLLALELKKSMARSSVCCISGLWRC